MVPDIARPGDVLVVWRLERLGRSITNLVELVGTLEDQGVGLRGLQETNDSTSSSGKLIVHLFGALSEFERNLIRDRTHAGLTAARARGRKGGRSQALDPAKRQLALSRTATYDWEDLPLDEDFPAHTVQIHPRGGRLM